MAEPIVATEQKLERPSPKTVLTAKSVDLALVSYADETGFIRTQLAVIGENNVHLIDGRPLGISKESTPQGIANAWLRDGIMVKLGRKAPEKK